MKDNIPPIRRQGPRSRYPWLDFAERAKAKPGRVVKVGEGIPRSSIVSARKVMALRNAEDGRGNIRVTQRDGRIEGNLGLVADVYFTYEIEE